METIRGTWFLGPSFRKVIVDQSNLAGKADFGVDKAHVPLRHVSVHQATGMVMAQSHLSPDEALQQLNSYAAEVGSSLEEVARDVVDRVISFVRDEDERSTG